MIAHSCPNMGIFQEANQEYQSSCSEFRSIAKIGRGSFGQILKIERICDGECFAMKMEKKNSFIKTLEFEYEVMIKLPKSSYSAIILFDRN
jgi:hypothetical protein